MLFRSNVNSLLSICELDTPLNSLLLHADTLCVLSCEEREELRGNMDQDGQGMRQEEEEEVGENCQAGLPAETTGPQAGLPAETASPQPDLVGSQAGSPATPCLRA